VATREERAFDLAKFVKDMSGPDRSARLVELVGPGRLDEVFQAKVRQRRWAIGLVTMGIAGIGAWLMSDMLNTGGWTALKAAELGIFVLLFSALAFGFTQAFVGFLVLAEGHEPLKITNTLDPATPLASTAITMPIFNEDAATVFGNIRTLYDSLGQRGELDSFEFYLLSDSIDPDKVVEEELAWADLCRQTNGFGRIHYRRRRLPVNRKSGNIADFCRRWGHRHRYMVVFDADSIMTGEAVSSLVRLMEVNPRAGIIQTMPKLVRANTLFGRIQQFASRLYSPVFAAGLNFWQQSAGNYWGHNAIIRVSPFLTSCGLPALPGREPLGGRVLSHDFVEAALMRHAGWEVWFAYDLDGSYEGIPPNLTEYVKRDRRWCQGNLQHMWFLLAEKVRPVSRLHLIQGILAYGSSPLLALFILFGTLQAAIDRWHQKTLNVQLPSAFILLFLTLLLLFSPKLMSLIHLFSKPESLRAYLGTTRALLGVACEILFSILIAPIMVWFHTRFVFRNLGGQTVTWNTQTRGGGAGPRWLATVAEYWPLPVSGIVLGLFAWWISPGYFLWLLPILIGLWLAIPLAQLSGRSGVFKNLFLTPEETEPPRELTTSYVFQLREGNQFMHAVLDPFYNAVHVTLQKQRRKHTPAAEAYVTSLAAKLFRNGPDALSAREKRALLADGPTIARLHTQIWQTPAQSMSPVWSKALESYRSPERRAEPAFPTGNQNSSQTGNVAA
jgi:membrane glycosyltransferase